VSAPTVASSSELLEEITRLRLVARGLMRRTAELQEALDSRVTIEQAKGILAERLEVTVDEAFALMRHGARSNHRKLHDLAREVVHSAETPAEIRRERFRRAVTSA
jgi:AmiR/NasT family two-component response regulator